MLELGLMGINRTIFRWMLWLLLAASVLQIISTGLLCVHRKKFPDSYRKMYLPWYGLRAIRYAKQYYYGYYKKPIRCRDVEVVALPDEPVPRYEYRIRFCLKWNPACEFDISVAYDVHTETHQIQGDPYEIQREIMKQRMKKDTRRSIRRVYGKYYGIQFRFQEHAPIEESTNLKDFKRQNDCRVHLILEEQRVTELSKKREAKRLYRICSKLGKKGYRLETLEYQYPKWGGKLKHDRLVIEVGQISSRKAARALLDKALLREQNGLESENG